MKKSILMPAFFLSLILVLSFMGKPLFAEALNLKHNEIIVTGQSQIITQADKVKISFNVEALKQSLKESKEELWQKIEDIENDVNNLSFEIDSFKVENFYAHKKHSYENASENLLGFFSQATLLITLSNFENLNILLSQISQNASTINHLQFFKENTESLYLQALSQAFENAKQKAENLRQKNNIFLVSLAEEIVNDNQFLNSKTLFDLNDNFDNKIVINAKVKAIFGFEEENKKNKVTLYDKNDNLQNTVEAKNDFSNYSAPRDKTSQLIKENNQELNLVNQKINSTESQSDKTLINYQNQDNNTSKDDGINKDDDISKENDEKLKPVEKLDHEKDDQFQHESVKNNLAGEKIITNTSFKPVSI